MADNFTANAGSGGSTFASDDIGGTQYPRVKITQGGDGSSDGDVSKTNPLPVTQIGLATNGLSVYRTLDADETEEEVKGSAGTLYGIWGGSTSSTTNYIKIYDATAGAVTVGTTTPILTLPIPGNSTDAVAFNWNLGGLGIAFANGICIAATTLQPDAASVGPSASAITANVLYK